MGISISHRGVPESRRRQAVLLSANHGLRLATMNWFVGLGLICLLGTGCSRKTYWYHPDRTLSEAERDCRECFRQAQTEAAEADRSQRLDQAEIQGESTDEQWSYAYQDARFRRCMKHRGYHLTPERQLEASVRKRVLRMGGIQSVPIAGW